jgi:RNA polymerase sigma factor (sigma-70 family)
MGVASTGVRPAIPGNFRSRRLLALAADERLVEQVRRGNEAAFDILFERYAPALLAFSRHMLRSREEAEDAVQLTFAAAHRALLREPERAVVLKPWLFTIARNRCFSMLRARREQPGVLVDLPSDGLLHQVEERAELRQLLADVRELPEDQRSALLLAELSDLSHAQVADVLGCEVARVKALVFQARTGLINRRRAR